MFNMINVSGGKTTLKEVESEIAFYMYHKSPKRLIIDISRESDGYRATLWMSEKDFKKPWQAPLPRRVKWDEFRNFNRNDPD
ncbi:MAG: hypothetical protein AAB922_07760 [Patescibacteria group bacterium]